MTIRRGQKKSFYFPGWMSREVGIEAARLDRSASWILQRAWKLARAALRSAPRRATAAGLQPTRRCTGSGPLP